MEESLAKSAERDAIDAVELIFQEIKTIESGEQRREAFAALARILEIGLIALRGSRETIKT